MPHFCEAHIFETAYNQAQMCRRWDMQLNMSLMSYKKVVHVHQRMVEIIASHKHM